MDTTAQRREKQLLTPEEIAALRKLPPKRLMRMVYTGLEHGWTAIVFRVPIEDGDGWKAIFRDSHHCLHLRYRPERVAKQPEWGPWTGCSPCHYHCASNGGEGTVKLADLVFFLETHHAHCSEATAEKHVHTARCLDSDCTGTSPGIASPMPEEHMCHCDGPRP